MTHEPSSDAVSPTPHAHGDTYHLAVQRDFVAQHFLTVPDPGPEGDVHSHHFTVAVRFSGPELGEYGYLVDIDAVDSILDDLEARYRDALLNDLPEFADLNPSVEHFARLFGDRVADALADPTPTGLTVRMWEDDVSWASHSRTLSD
ncbi:6-pyruvoyl trahydropterin synthase family protein [Halobellus clavatus]|uniref:6-pyruvoyltetrahydropterin/6-carboxytetrahydropterin synthase n=1 Tax=Halobellus clavatus TaxID=660517 RepID=A0A1H3GQP2_9EURY|nr:6-carboxytetrahydropterin synthase [Halobellus clavatus]SDY04794.1 6-pyruvoyltetrahydropterin/6-carboxytetrahydropterin synthase [Halobellus clavatus]